MEASQGSLFSIHKKELVIVKLADILEPEKRLNNKTKKGVAYYQDLYDALTLQKQGQHFKIIDGIGRYWSAKEAGLQEVPAMVVEGDETALALLGVSLNVCRSPSLVHEAKMLKQAMSEGVTMEMLSDMGLDAAAVKRRIRITDLPDDVLDAVGKKVSIGLAEKVANLPDEEREVVLAAIRAEEKRFTEAHYREIRTSQKGEAGEELADLVQEPLFDPLDQAFDYLLRLAGDMGLSAEDLQERWQNKLQAAGGQP